MAKKIVKRKKLRVFRLLLVLLVLLGLFLSVRFFVNIPIQNIIVKNTSYLNDYYILELAEIRDYPSFILTSGKKIKERLEDSPYINKVKVKKSFFNVVTIYVDENKALFYDNTDKKIIFDNNEAVELNEITDDFRIPRLLNYVPDSKYKSFIKGMKNIEEDVLGKISDIEYKPNQFDKDRFLLYMDDGNMVYLTLTKFKMINYYNDVLTQLEDKKGILYLDNGNHFQIKE